MNSARPLYKLGLQICALVMLSALVLGAVSWLFFDAPSRVVLGLFAVLAAVGIIGIGLLLIDFVKHGHAR